MPCGGVTVDEVVTAKAIAVELVVEPEVPDKVMVYEPIGVVDFVEIVRVGPGNPSTGVPGLTLSVLVLNETVGPLVTAGETVAARLTVPWKPLRPVTPLGRVTDAPWANAALLPLLTTKVGAPEHVTRVAFVSPGVGSPVAVRHDAPSNCAVRLS